MTTVATICASLQSGSSNEIVLGVLEELLREAGHGVDRVEGLAHLPPFRPDTEPTAAVAGWAGAIAPCDGVVIATPEYAAGPPGVLKNGLDWLVGLSTLYRKPAAVVCAGSTGGAFTIEALVRTLSYQGALTVATLGIAGIRTKLAPDGSLVDESTLRALRRASDRLDRALAADEPELLSMVSSVVAPHGVDPMRFGLRASTVPGGVPASEPRTTKKGEQS